LASASRLPPFRAMRSESKPRFTHDGRAVRFLNLIDEYTQECLAIHAGRRINSNPVIDVLAEAIIEHGIPDHIRSDNGPEFVPKALRNWLATTGARTLYIEPRSPWENGYRESFNSKIRDEFLKGEIIYSLKEVRVLTESWRVYYNTERPHSSLGYRPQAPTDVADRSFPAVWKSGRQRTLSTFPHRLLLRRADISLSRCATQRLGSFLACRINKQSAALQ
jgi:putative transposase